MAWRLETWGKKGAGHRTSCGGRADGSLGHQQPPKELGSLGLLLLISKNQFVRLRLDFSLSISSSHKQSCLPWARHRHLNTDCFVSPPLTWPNFLTCQTLNSWKKVWCSWDLPDGPVAKTPCSQCRGPGFEIRTLSLNGFTCHQENPPWSKRRRGRRRKSDAPFVSNPYTLGKCTIKSTGWVPMFFQNSDLTYELCAFGESDFTSLNLIMTCTMGKIIDRWGYEMRSWKYRHNTLYFIILLPYAL